ncbi:hypothetical protein FN846DRAFT_1020796 [Sphaerosporella brunnea]|uniref:Uncharacterized protein n=1 Tax=Sphaerosporella brunnea TaxID=1250544 RepID=A0A5J5F047_9PEZI|nr:hypothetical protein FN846DRAFT_1020796 [Sphaerosporella brunnea]
MGLVQPADVVINKPFKHNLSRLPMVPGFQLLGRDVSYSSKPLPTVSNPGEKINDCSILSTVCPLPQHQIWTPHGSCDRELSVKDIPKEDLVIGDWNEEPEQETDDDAAAVEFVWSDDFDQLEQPALVLAAAPPGQQPKTNPLWDVPARAHAFGELQVSKSVGDSAPQRKPASKKSNYRCLSPDDDLWNLPAHAHATDKIPTPNTSTAFW